jgi:hypothetical protein
MIGQRAASCRACLCFSILVLDRRHISYEGCHGISLHVGSNCTRMHHSDDLRYVQHRQRSNVSHTLRGNEHIGGIFGSSTILLRPL